MAEGEARAPRRSVSTMAFPEDFSLHLDAHVYKEES